MNHSKKSMLSRICFVAALAIGYIMAAIVAYLYADFQCCALHRGCSAPPEIAFLYAVPFSVIITVLVLIGIWSRKN